MLKTEYPRIGETVLSETLENGLRVIVVPKPGYRRRYAFFATRYGGMDMRFRLGGVWQDTPAGIAHYLEHKMFDTREGSALQMLSQNGAEPNAFTSNSMTAYYFDCTEHFEENLRILLSFVSEPWFTADSVEKERGIIAQEIRMTEDSPDWQVYKNLLSCLYRSNPARVPVAGTVESIRRITPQTLYDCHRAFYTPSNMVLCVVGDLEPDPVLSAVRDILPSARGETIERDYGAEEELRAFEKSSTRAMEIAVPQFLAGFKCPAPAEGAELFRQGLIGELACDILLGESSPLYLKLYDEGLINGSFGSDFDQLPGAAYFYAGGECKEPERVAHAIMDEAARLAREGLNEDFYRQIIRANFGASLRSLNSFENIAINMADGWFRGFDAYRFPELYDSITREDIADFLRENITEERLAMSLLVPAKEAEA